MSNVLSTNEVAKNKVPDLLKDTLAVTGMIKDGIIDFAVSSNDVKASPLNDGILEFFVMRSPSQAGGWHKAWEF